MSDNISPMEWERIIDDYKQSGLSAANWAERNNLSAHKLRYWIKQFKRQATEATTKEQQWISLPISRETASKINIKIGTFYVEV